MIDFALAEEHAIVAATAREFAARWLRPDHRAHERAGVGEPVLAAAHAAGLDALWSHELDAIARAAALEELAYGDAGATLAIVGPALAEAMARKLDAPGSIAAVHVYEDAPPDRIAWLPMRPATDVRILQLAASGAWRVVVARAEPITTLGLRAAGGARCTVLDVIARGASSGEAVAEIRLAIAALLVGVARAAHDYACAYVQERRAFSKRLADHQAIAFIIADVALAIAAARALVQRAALTRRGAAHAFVEAAAAALVATERAVQLLGGHGYLQDHPVEKWMRDARALALTGGGRDAAALDSEDDAWEERWT